MSRRAGRLTLLFGVAAGLLYLNKHWLRWPLPTVVTSYLADVLALPLLFTAALLLMRHGYFRQAAFVLPGSWVVAAWALLSLWFEWWLPRVQPAAVADPLDVLAYAVGAWVFWRWLNVPARR